MKLTEKQIETAKCTLIDEVCDFILERVCSVMYETAKISGGELDLEQIDEVVTSVYKGLYYEKEETKQ